MDASILGDNHLSDMKPDASNESEHTLSARPSSEKLQESGGLHSPVVASEDDSINRVTISKNTEQSSSKIYSLDPDQVGTNHRESNIKLKRCKHGRIIIKDLSKRKLVQHSDTEANNCISKAESNNNHVANSNKAQVNLNNSNNEALNEGNHLGTDHQISKQGSRQISPEPINSRTQDPSLPHTPPHISHEKKSSYNEKPVSKDKSTNNEHIDTKSDSWSATSSTSSLSPLPIRRKRSRSPARHARKSRSPRSRDRSTSHSRRITSRRRRDIPTSRYRERTPVRRRKKSRSSHRHRDRSSDRDRVSGKQRYRYHSPLDRSPPRRHSRSRSSTPLKRDRSRRRDRLEDSPSRSRDRSRYDRSSRRMDHDTKNDMLEKASRVRSPRSHRSNLEDVESKNVSSHHVTSQNLHNSQPKTPESRLPISSIQFSQNHALSKLSPKNLQTEDAPKTSSPTNRANDFSAASDIYDPEGPIIPISPGDSPPTSSIDDAAFNKKEFHPRTIEKTGEDDVPSSAVQLNQQEKYLQKLNRQERVVEEVKIALKPFYQNRTIDKEQYKDVLRKAVPKICHSKNGEINPIKIRSLVDAYVRKMK